DELPEGGRMDNPAFGLDNNPGKDAILFSDTHPYNPPNCNACTLPGKRIIRNTKGGIFQAFSKRKDCYHCSRPKELIRKTEESNAKKAEIENAKRQAIEDAKQFFKPSTIRSDNLLTGVLNNSKKGLMNVLHHPLRNIGEVNAAMGIVNHIEELKFIRVSPFGEGKDLIRDAKNLAKKKNMGIMQFNVYEYHYEGKAYYVKTAQYEDGFEMLYSFTKKP
ncbi:MAG: hypothetical protein LBH04_04860, partial [Tannerellaceae bacterium]|nr:hypothetical protein [Tannerellaceae bacterium]